MLKKILHCTINAAKKQIYSDKLRIYTMYNEAFKIFGDFKTPAFDFNSLFEVQRRNIEALTAANQLVAESAQAIAKRQAEVLRSNVDEALNASKDLASNGTPELNVEKQATMSKAMFEKSLSDAREFSEMISKSSFEAFDLLNKRAAESFDELGAVANTAAKK